VLHKEEQAAAGWRGISELTRTQVQGDVLVLYVYQLRKDGEGNENVAVEKVSFRKNGGGAS